MKFLLSCVLLIIGTVALSQTKKPVSNTLSAQLKSLSAAAPANFKSIRNVKYEVLSSDTIYSSKITLAGTYLNKIHVNNPNAYYEAVIADSLDVTKGVAMYMEYETKLDNILSKTYTKKNRTIDDDNYGTGRQFTYVPIDGPFSNAWITLTLLNETDSKTYSLKIAVRKP